MPRLDATRRQLLLLAILILVSLSSAAIAIGSLYQAAMNQQRTMLREVAVSQASLIDAVAAFDARWPSDFPGSAIDGTLFQVRAANAAYEGFGDTGEFTLARRDGDQILFMLSHRFGESQPGEAATVPWRSELAEPMRRALSGDATTLVGLDYRGERVLAAAQPIAGLGWGLVAKIDLAEVQRPFFIAAAVSLVLTLLLASAGVWLFLHVTNPLLRELAEREARFRALFANAPNGIALVDQHGRPRISNPALHRFLGRTAEALAETPFSEFTHPEDLNTDRALYQRLWDGEIPSYQLEKRYLRADGTIIWGLLTVALIKDDRGTVLGAVAMVTDISEQRRMRQELTEAYERSVEIEKLSALGSFVGGVAHEVKNPLMGLINYLDYLKLHITEPKLVDILGRARHQVKRIDTIVDGILHYARGSAGHLAPTSIAKVVDAIAGLLQNPLATSDAQLTQCISPDLPELLTDPVIVEQALLNLVLNAIDAVKDQEQRRIEISAEQAGEAVELTVDDSGPGVPEALIGRIFDPFFTTKPPGVGTGLGLSVTARNLNLIGGDLTVTRGALGGARFVIRLPVEPPDALRQQHRPDGELGAL
jgi:PAS domain S-box-containing protein